jgi:hypothetical protein
MSEAAVFLISALVTAVIVTIATHWILWRWECRHYWDQKSVKEDLTRVLRVFKRRRKTN